MHVLGGGGDGGGFQMMEALQEVPNMSTRVKKKKKSTSIYVFIKKRKEKKETEITFSILIIAITTFLKATQKAKDRFYLCLCLQTPPFYLEYTRHQHFMYSFFL